MSKMLVNLFGSGLCPYDRDLWGRQFGAHLKYKSKTVESKWLQDITSMEAIW